MAFREIRVVGDPVLRTPCDWITDPRDPGVKQLVEDLLENVDEDGRAGLAANQIGVSLRAFSWNIDGEVGYVLNPKLVATSEDEFQDGDEGCLSVPGKTGIVTRPERVRVRALDAEMEPFELEAEGLLARAVCHELAHLDGQLYVELVEGELMDVESEEESGEE